MAVVASVCKRLEETATEAQVQAVLAAQAAAGWYLAESVSTDHFLYLFFSQADV